MSAAWAYKVHGEPVTDPVEREQHNVRDGWVLWMGDRWALVVCGTCGIDVPWSRVDLMDAHTCGQLDLFGEVA